MQVRKLSSDVRNERFNLSVKDDKGTIFSAEDDAQVRKSYLELPWDEVKACVQLFRNIVVVEKTRRNFMIQSSILPNTEYHSISTAMFVLMKE